MLSRLDYLKFIQEKAFLINAGNVTSDMNLNPKVLWICFKHVISFRRLCKYCLGTGGVQQDEH